MSNTCHCGHVLDEHGGDAKYPRALACSIEGCDCLHYEENEDAEED